jgi:hypothetical protein
VARTAIRRCGWDRRRGTEPLAEAADVDATAAAEGDDARWGEPPQPAIMSTAAKAVPPFLALTVRRPAPTLEVWQDSPG